MKTCVGPLPVHIPARVQQRVQRVAGQRQTEGRSRHSRVEELHPTICRTSEPARVSAVARAPHPDRARRFQALRRDTCGTCAAEQGWGGLWERGQSEPDGHSEIWGKQVS